MAKQVRFEGNTYSVPDDATDQEIFSYVESQAAPAASRAQTPIRPNPMLNMPGAMAGYLPSLLGMGGGFAGRALSGPAGFAVGPAAAGVGGALGAFGQQALMGQALDPRAAVGAGGEQAGLEAAGGIMAGALRGMARPFMQMALRPRIRTARLAHELGGKCSSCAQRAAEALIEAARAPVCR